MYSCLIQYYIDDTSLLLPTFPSTFFPIHPFLPPFFFCLSLPYLPPPSFSPSLFSPSLPPLGLPGSVQNINPERVTADVTRLIVSWDVPAVTNGQLISHQVVVTHRINGRMIAVYSETVSGSTFSVNITGLRKYHLML